MYSWNRVEHPPQIGEYDSRKRKDLIIFVSHPGRLQLLDILVGAIALVVFSSNHIVVGPNRKEEAEHQHEISTEEKKKISNWCEEASLLCFYIFTELLFTWSQFCGLFSTTTCLA